MPEKTTSLERASLAEKTTSPERASLAEKTTSPERASLAGKTRSLDCAPVAEKIRRQCRREAAELGKISVFPKLALLRVGENAADLSYEKGALKAMKLSGIRTERFVLPAAVSVKEYGELLKRLGGDGLVHGILPFLPFDFSDGSDASSLIGELLNPLKDVDAVTAAGIGAAVRNDGRALFPCTAAAIMEILDYYGTELKGKHVVIVNNSNVVGKPLSMMLTNRYATVTLCHEFTEGLAEICRTADILVCAVPKANVIGGSFVTEKTLVIDASVISVCDGNGRQVTSGCCDDEVYKKAALVTPVPGVGAVTSAMLAKNVIKACKFQNSID